MRAILPTSLGLLLTASGAYTHHSFVAIYDPARPATLTGVITRVEWLNPHARFYADIEDPDGATARITPTRDP